MRWALLLLAACATRGPAVQRPAWEGSSQFSIESGSGRFLGTAIVRFDDSSYELRGVTLTGITLFTARGDGDRDTVEAPDPTMERTLRHIPFGRDLDLVWRLECADRCQTPRGRLTNRADGVTRWRGEGGPATVRREGDLVVVEDRQRNYTLTVVGRAP